MKIERLPKCRKDMGESSKYNDNWITSHEESRLEAMTKIAIRERNIAIKIATWLPRGVEAGGITILKGHHQRIKIAIAVSNAV